MPREVKLRMHSTRDGSAFHVALFDDRGRFVLTARTETIDAAIAEEIATYLQHGRVTWLASRAVRTANP